MRFVLNNKPVELIDAAADISLLRYLRDQAKLMGTKEGCASGDCGACTVIVGRPTEKGLVYSAVNACICPLGSLQNCQVFTIEALAESAESLHPVQAAMVECHGSQCGFCTPGIVMSLASLHLNKGAELAAADEAAQRAAVIDAISGNLCRCTGYRPIVAAGIAALKKPAQAVNFVQEWCPVAPSLGKMPQESAGHSVPDLTQRSASQSSQLSSQPSPQPSSQPSPQPSPQQAPLHSSLLLAPSLTNSRASYYWQPQSEVELQLLLQKYPQARLVAGGTDLMLEVTQQYKQLPELIDVTAVPSLQQIELNHDEISIGAAVCYSRLEKTLAQLSPQFVTLLGRLGSRQIRNRGTLGGNICNASPIADSPPYLLALDAEVVIVNAQGETRREPLAHFYRGYKQTSLERGEYLARICIKREQLAQPLRLFKISKRYEDDISAVMGAFHWNGADKFKIAFGGMAAIPKRASKTEIFLSENTWCDAGIVKEQIIEQACALLRSEFSPLSDVRASAQYRLAMACNLLKKSCYEFAAEAAGKTPEPRLFAHA